MKAKLTFRKTPLFVFYILWFLVSALSASAQCPTITNSNPPPICDASGFTFNDLNTFANDEGDGIVWYDTATGGTPFDANTFVQEGTYYADDNSGSCVTRMSINVDFQVDATGQNLDRVYCSNENPIFQTYIDEILQPNTPAGGSAAIYRDINLTDQVNPTEAIDNIVNYLIVFIDALGCESQVETARIIVIDAPDPPTPTNPQMFCSDANPTIANLDPGTTESFNWYARLNGSGNPVFPALNPSTALVNGRTYYVQVNGISCNSDPVAVTVTINTPVDAGTLSSLQFCDDSLPTTDINLFDELGGSPDTTGSWTGPLPISNGNLGTINISTLTAGTYVFTYTVPTTGVCPDGSSTVTINVFATLSPGTVATGVQSSFCESLLPSNFDLFSLLENEDPGGQWTRGATSTDPVVTSPIDLNGLVSGVYSFTYTQNVMPNPCPENSTTVEVTVLEDPNAGVAVNQSFCERDLSTSSPFDLFDALDGSQDNNLGTWRDANNVIVSNPIDISSFTSTDSPYRFNYTVDNGICFDIEVITITVLESPESGTPVATFPEFCQGIAPSNFDLFTLLDGEDQTGIWYSGIDNTGATIINPTDLSSLVVGTYDFTYEVAAIGACDDALVTVQVIINPIPNTGSANNPAPFCENDAALGNTSFDLFTLLNPPVDAGGTWTDDDATGTLSGNNVDLTGLATGSFNFTYSITDANNCSNSTTVTITIDDAPESGTANTPEAFCIGDITTGQTYNLFDLLTDEDQTGIWTDDDGTGALSANTVTLDGLLAGTYNFTYNVNAIGSCDDVDVTVSIIINLAPNTGTPTPAIFCENDLAGSTPLDLFNQLTGEDTGGTWTDDDATGTLSGNNVDLTGLAIGSFNFTYSITDANNCSNSTTVTITIDDAPESGTANTPEAFCIGDITTGQTYNLFDLLTDEDQTGIWTDDDGTGALSANTVTLDGLTAGTYNFTYNVNAIGSCDDVDVTVSIIINPAPNTGTPTPAIFCENDLAGSTSLNLFNQLTGEDTGGTWADDDATGTLSGNNVDLTGLAIGSFNFTYSITDANNCSNSTTVTITIDDAPESGTANAPEAFCIGDITTGQTYNLFDLLTDEDQTGIWTDDDATGALSANTVTLDGLLEGTYNFTYNVNAIGSCDDVDVTVSIIINDTPAPTANVIQTFCDSATVADLVATGTNIQWYEDATGGTPLADTVILVDSQDYFATQTNNTTSCESSVRTQVNVDIVPLPNAGDLATTPLLVCNNTTINLNDGLDGSQDTGGTWYQGTDTTGTVVIDGTMFDVNGFVAGNYQFTYAVSAPPCADASITISVTVDAPFNPGTSNSLNTCSNNGTTDLFPLLGGADVGGIWSPALDSTTGVFNPLTDTAGLYTYSFTNACGTFSSEIMVIITPAPNAGMGSSVTFCAGDDAVDLFTLLGTDAQTGGTWSPALASSTGVFDPALDSDGVYTYTVIAIAPCSPNAEAQITITINDTPAVGVIESNPSFCLIDNPIVADLADSVNITGTVNWYEDMALTLPLNDDDALEDGEDYYATQTNISGCESSTSVLVNVTINDADTPTLRDDSIAFCVNDNPTLADILSNITEYDEILDNIRFYDEETNGLILSSDTALISRTTYYIALFDAVTGCESSIRLEYTPDLTDCGELFLPDGFSPNGDRKNDTFNIDNLDIIYPDYQIEIYNRYGNIVYKGTADTPPFDGTSNQPRTLLKGDLPVGVYFYIFNFNDGKNKPKQGRLYLSR
ncbi:gliding motility-associated C-terminal domain-containing protein [uncultured Algibacter sp.]|uniref:Ig-like domain-containing protein n=1 Tax=uncultured Algibacter sp. TaxID=298659 RepID=UPI003217052F